ncbi:MAG: hypothetical protein MZV70_18060 [Desulfobacterales bacterium]|nr:hypothetical protein [Desulfobacterales bacterium]
MRGSPKPSAADGGPWSSSTCPAGKPESGRSSSWTSAGTPPRPTTQLLDWLAQHRDSRASWSSPRPTNCRRPPSAKQLTAHRADALATDPHEELVLFSAEIPPGPGCPLESHSEFGEHGADLPPPEDERACKPNIMTD